MADYPGKNQSAAAAFQQGFNDASARGNDKKKKPDDTDQQSNYQTAKDILADTASGISDAASSAAEVLGLKKKKDMQ